MLLCQHATLEHPAIPQVKELRDLLQRASADFPQLAEHASFLDDKVGGTKRWGGMVGDALRSVAAKRAPLGSPVAGYTPETEVTKEVRWAAGSAPPAGA